MLKKNGWFLLLLTLILMGGCKVADPRPICETHDPQGDKHSDAAHATCPADTPDDDHDDGHDDH